MKAETTNGIPICPYCKKPTKRTETGPTTRTAAYYAPVYDVEGRNTNPDRNITKTFFRCEACNQIYQTATDLDGCRYVGASARVEEDVTAQ